MWHVQGMLHRAAARGDAEELRSLLDSGWFDINSPRLFSAVWEKRSRERTPLMYAVLYGRLGAAEILAQRGASVGSSLPSSSLRWSILLDRVDIFERLVVTPSGRNLAAASAHDLLKEAVTRKSGARMVAALLKVLPNTDSVDWSEIATHVHVRNDLTAMCETFAALIAGGMPPETRIADDRMSVTQFLEEQCGQAARSRSN
jgi:hypothetical protein